MTYLRGEEARSVGVHTSLSLLLASVCVCALTLALMAAPALAAPPEAPETGVAQVTNTTAVLNGVLNPHASASTGWYFRYAEGSACSGNATPSHSPVPVAAEHVSVQVTGLQPGTAYAFCLVAVNESNETTAGSAVSFVTSARPALLEQSLFDAGSTTASVGVQIQAGGLPTTYHVEYGTTEAYGSNTAELDIYGPTEAVSVREQLTGLQPGTTYHFRFLATNASGVSAGPDVAFSTATTQATGGGTAACPNSTFVGFSSLLPDCRADELVSRIVNDQGEYVPSPGEVYVPEAMPFERAEDTVSAGPFQVSSEGEAALYAGDPPATEGNGREGSGAGNEYLAKRNPARGWEAHDITPPSGAGETASETLTTGYQAFASDLSVGIVESGARALALAAEPAGALLSCHVLYSTAGNATSFDALFTQAEAPEDCGHPVFAGGNEGTSTVAKYSHLLFQDEAALTPQAQDAAGSGDEVTGELCARNCNLYESVGGRLSLINVLPQAAGGTPAPNAAFGSAPQEGNDLESMPDLSNVISADGALVYWTDLEAPELEHVYVRENATRTIAVSAGAAQFWTASPDGRVAFYTEGEKLWRFDLDKFESSDKPEPEALAEAREDLTPEGLGHESPGVQGVVGINDAGEDGAYVYLVAAGKLASNKNAQGEEATPRSCQQAEGSTQGAEEETRGLLPPGIGCNLYVLRSGQAPTFIATLVPRDDKTTGRPGNGAFVPGGDWQPDLGARTAEVTPDGRGLTFETRRALTGYDNISSAAAGSDNTEALTEVFVYDAGTGGLYCASCSPTGAPPVAEPYGTTPREVSHSGGGTYLPVSAGFGVSGARTGDTVMRRWLNEAGTQVFFDTSQPLVSSDANGVQDVYEWEREGPPDEASCPARTPARPDGGCVFLLSGGQSSDYSYFVDASANGQNAFFTTREKLVSQDRGEQTNLYDVRVDGGLPESALACTGTGCQGVPPAAPLFAAPASATFSGLGNFSPPPAAIPAPPKSKPRAVKCSRHGSRGAAKHGKCVKAKKKKKSERKSAKKRSKQAKLPARNGRKR